jgi:hypothetical protein
MNLFRRSSSLVSWFGRLLSPRRRRSPRHQQPARRLVLERLEDRTVPSGITQVDYGGLRFIASDGFMKDSDNDLHAQSGTVSIGYTPAGNESFQPLTLADLTHQQGTNAPALWLFTGSNPTQPRFTLELAELDLVAGNPVLPIPIYQAPQSAVLFDIAALTGPSGVSLDPADGKPVEVGKLNFTLSTLYFADPTPAQVEMQGQLSFNNIPLLSTVAADVNNINYVIADHTGITVTGATIKKAFEFDKVTVDGSITVGYDKPSDTFNFGGDVKVTTKPQGPDQKVALSNLQAGINAAVVEGKLDTFGFDVGASVSFPLLGVSVSTVGSSGQPFTFHYNTANQEFELSGGLEVDFNDSKVITDFGTVTSPGILIQGGQLTQLNATVSGDLNLERFSAHTNGLTFQYDRASDQFEMYGALQVNIPTGDTTQVIAAQMGSASDPGLVLVDGHLKQLNMRLNGNFDIYGLHLRVNDAGVQWQPADGTFLLGGTFFVDYGVFQTTLTLGSAANPGLQIVNGMFKVDNVRFEVDNVSLGSVVTINQLAVSYAADGNSYDLGVTGKVTLPGGWTVDGVLDLVAERVHDIALSFSSAEGIPVGDTGLFLTQLGGSIKNLDNPANIVVTAHMAVTWGETFNLFGHQVKLFRAEGDVTVDANELILGGSVQLGAYSTDGGNTWQAAAGQGDARMTLDWGDHLYSPHVDVKGPFLIFDLSGDLTFDAGKEIKFLATVDVVVPSAVPFIGGDTIGGVGFYFDHVFAHDGIPTSTTLAAWLDIHVIWTFEVGFQLVYDDADPGGAFSLIGASTIDNFKREAQPPVDQTYTYTADLAAQIPPNATTATVSADWSKTAAGVTIVGTPKFRVQYTPVSGQPVTYTEDQLPANIQIINDPKFTSGTHKAIQIVGSPTDAYAPITGDYKLLVDVTAEGGNPFPGYADPTAAAGDELKVQATYHIPRPTFGARNAQGPYQPTVPPAPGGTFPVVLQGSMDEGFLGQPKTTVELYRVLANDPPQRAVLIGTAAPQQVSGDGINWQATVNVPVSGLYPLPYTVYAVVNDGFNAPVKTASSPAFLPAFAVEGNVANQNGDALPGWQVFLDYNRDGIHEANEPIFQTRSPDGFYAFTSTFDPSTGWDPIPLDRPFDVRLVVPSPGQYVPAKNPVTVTYNGIAAKAVSFVVQQATSIQGTVYGDLPSGRVPLAGWTAFLDANGNGVLDPGERTALTDANGLYAFFDLPPDSTQTVVAQPAPGYYVTGPDRYTVAVGSAPSTVYDNNDFAILPFSTLGGQVLGPGSLPLGGWTVNLTQGGQVVASTTSAADGSYTFASVRAGSYAVEEGTPLTWQPLAPLAVTVPPTQDVSGVNLVNVQLLDSLLPDGGFETPVVGNGPYAYQYSPTGSPWTFTSPQVPGSGAGVSGNGSGFTDGNPDAPQGSQVAFLQGTGTISQSAYFAPGTYSIRFLAAQRGDQFQAGSQTFAAQIDDTVVGTFTPADTSYRLLSTDSFTVTAGYHTISFVGRDPAAQDTAFLDAVNIHALTSVADPGFETPVVGSGPNAYQYSPTGSPWTFVSPQVPGSGAGVSGNGSGFTDGNPDAPQGSQVAFLQGTGTISQTVNFVRAGTYTLSFLAAQRGDLFQASSQTFAVKIDGNVVGTFTPSDQSYRPYTTDGFAVTAGNHTVTFVGLDPAGTQDTAFLDAVSVQLLSGVLDGGFETPAVGSDGNAFEYSPTGSPWTFVSPQIPGSGAGVSGNNSGFTAANPDAPDGTQVAFLQQTGSFSQAINFAAGTYSVSFLAAQRANVQADRQTFAVAIDGTLLGQFTPPDTNYHSFTTDSFTVTAGYHTISFVGLDPAASQDTAFLDAVSVRLLPGVSDGGFEIPVVGSGVDADLFDPSGSAWTFSGTAGVAGNGSPFTAGNPDPHRALKSPSCNRPAASARWSTSRAAPTPSASSPPSGATATPAVRLSRCRSTAAWWARSRRRAPTTAPTPPPASR